MNDHLKKLEDQCWTQIPCDFDMMADGMIRNFYTDTIVQKATMTVN